MKLKLFGAFWVSFFLGGVCFASDCPFETVSECKIWEIKPAIRETGASQNYAPSSARINKIIERSRAGNSITSDNEDTQPLIEIYKALLSVSHTCCHYGMVSRLRGLGYSSEKVYEIMADDANLHQSSERCLMVTDKELDETYSDTNIANAISETRDACLCNQKNYLLALLSPFQQIADSSENFTVDPLDWQYTDGLNRTVLVSINRDVGTVLGQMSNCQN